MAEDVWSKRDTDPDAIEAALRELLRERHAANQELAPARVLNLVVVVDREWKGEIANRLERVGRYHASRTILCAVEEGRDSLDATAVMAYDEPSSGIGVIHEQVEIDIGPQHLGSLHTIVDPVLVSELPTVLWVPHGHNEAVDVLAGITDVLLLDSDDVPDPSSALSRAVKKLEQAYVVDLAWLRTTPWRERLATSFDPADRLCCLCELDRLAVRHHPSSTASALLLAGWLSSRLHWEPRRLESVGRDAFRASAQRGEDEIRLEFDPAEQDVPGLAGVTVSCSSSDFSLSLDRAPGGLQAREHVANTDERVWKVMGASRGEGGILGEGVRQALLRDPTYGPALDVALELCPQ